MLYALVEDCSRKKMEHNPFKVPDDSGIFRLRNAEKARQKLVCVPFPANIKLSKAIEIATGQRATGWMHSISVCATAGHTLRNTYNSYQRFYIMHYTLRTLQVS